MASFLTDLAKPFVEKLINRVIAESSYICCFTCIAKDFEEEKPRLKIERETFNRQIEKAIRRGEDVRPTALAWKDEVDQLIQEDTKKEKRCFFEFCPHCLWRHSRGKFLADKKEKIKMLMETGKEHIVGDPATLPDIERCATQHYMHLKSRESQYTKLMDELKDDSNYIIGLHGMGGTGKTTLIKKVGKELKQSKHFSQVIVTTVSLSPNIKKIQDDIAGPLDLKINDCNDSDRPKKLWHRLTNGEKILLILDDVWDYVNFEEIGIPCSDTHKGCRIIITTRDWSVCNKLECNKTIQLDLLSKEDAWIMFKKYADLSETSAKCFRDKGRKIASECKNLPIAITVIASSLKGKQHQEEWDLALKFLKKDISRHNDDAEFREIYKCFQFSYDKLKKEAKSLFLLCSLFREDEDIDTESLARLAIGGGLLGEDYASYEDARSLVIKSKRELLDSCLLLEAGQRSVKMHDFARDAAHWIEQNKIQTTKMYDKNQKAKLEREKNIKYLLCEGNGNEVFSCKFDGSKLEILIVIDVYDDSEIEDDDREIEVPNSFFENKTSLRVFHLRGYGFRGNISLPQSMQQLKNIRSLIFTRCKLGDISFFGNLQSLEELDLDCCEINEMPNGITKLEKFRLLKLDFCSIGGNNPFEVIKRCSSLQELYFRFQFNPFCEEITFPKLQRFHVTDQKIDFSVLKCVSIEESDRVFLSKTKLKYCMEEAEVLRLKRIEGEWRNIIPDIVHMGHGMNDMVELCLNYMSQLKCLIDTTKHTYSQVSNVFSMLVVLKLKHMENLEELCHGSLSVDSFKSLESLSLENCKHLQSLSGIANQCNLKSVSLIRCPMLISLFEVSTSVSLVLLERLIVVDCENLEIILPSISAHDLPALKSIKVKFCDKLKYIFGQGVELGSLKVLIVVECTGLEYIFGHYTNDHRNHTENDLLLSSLEDLGLYDLPSLVSICPKQYHITMPLLKYFVLERCYWDDNKKSIGDFIPHHSISRAVNCTTMKELSGSMEDSLALKEFELINSKVENMFRVNEVNEQQVNFGLQNIELENFNVMLCPFVGPKNSLALPNLTKIEITDCKNLQIIFSASILRCLPQLKFLRIGNCDELKHIIEGDLENQNMSNSASSTTCFPKLAALEIEYCYKLKYVFPVSICNELPKLKILVIKLAFELEEIFKSSEGEGIEKVMIPNLKLVVFHHLPSLSQTQEIQIQRAEYRFIQHCDKLSLTSTSIRPESELLWELVEEFQDLKNEGYYLYHRIVDFFYTPSYYKDEAASKEDLTSPQIKIKQTQETDQEFVENVVGLVTPSVAILPTNSEVSMNEQCPLEETDATVTPSQLEGAMSEKIIGTQNESPTQLVAPNQKGIERSVEEETASTNTKTTTSSTRLESELINEQSTTQRQSLGESHTIIKPSQGNNGSTSEKIAAATLSTISGTKNESPIQKGLNYTSNLGHPFDKQGVKKRVEQGTTSTNSKAIKSPGPTVISEHNRSSKAPMNELTMDQRSPLEETGANVTPSEELINEQSTTQQSLGESQASIKPSKGNNDIKISVEGGTASTNVKTLAASTTKREKPSHGIEISVEQGTTTITSKESTSSSPIVTSEHNSLSHEYGNGQTTQQSFSISTKEPLAMEVVDLGSSLETNQIKSLGDTSQVVEGLGSSLLVRRELEQLVSEKHLNYETLSLLTDFLVKYPSVLLNDASLTSRYKGYAYNCLAELLKFLQTHSVLDVLGSSHSEFVGLIQDVRKFSFNKDWLDGVEKRALFPDLQFSRDTMQKLLDSKKQVTKEVEQMRLKLYFINQHVEDIKHQLTSSEAVLASIIQQEEHVLETTAALSVPLGY